MANPRRKARWRRKQAQVRNYVCRSQEFPFTDYDTWPKLKWCSGWLRRNQLQAIDSGYGFVRNHWLEVNPLVLATFLRDLDIKDANTIGKAGFYAN